MRHMARNHTRIARSLPRADESSAYQHCRSGASGEEADEETGEFSSTFTPPTRWHPIPLLSTGGPQSMDEGEAAAGVDEHRQGIALGYAFTAPQAVGRVLQVEAGEASIGVGHVTRAAGPQYTSVPDGCRSTDAVESVVRIHQQKAFSPILLEDVVHSMHGPLDARLHLDAQLIGARPDTGDATAERRRPLLAPKRSRSPCQKSTSPPVGPALPLRLRIVRSAVDSVMSTSIRGGRESQGRKASSHGCCCGGCFSRRTSSSVTPGGRFSA